ncbi:hypothetical protein RNZ50_20845 [Paracoccaceae bacterium Fryx2]|nr:hypothetical protein [Paracoccaceae bacterium Fryx2]
MSTAPRPSEILAETVLASRRRMPQNRPSIFRRMTTTLVAVSTALGLMAGTTLPAHADNDDLAKALAAFAAIAIIGTAISDRDDHRPPPPNPFPYQPQPRPPIGHPVLPPPYPHHPYPKPPVHPAPPPYWHGHAPSLPAVCAMQIDGYRSSVVYPEPCLRNNGVRARLPANCGRGVYIRGRSTRVYAQNCLLNAGFRIEQRRWR